MSDPPCSELLVQVKVTLGAVTVPLRNLHQVDDAVSAGVRLKSPSVSHGSPMLRIRLAIAMVLSPLGQAKVGVKIDSNEMQGPTCEPDND